MFDWFARTARDLPWRRTLDPYGIWISEIMLQQTQVKTVIPYWTQWMKALPDPKSLARSPQDKVLKLWEGLGYYTRARNLQTAAETISREHGGTFPRDYEAVLALPGIGRYTAGAICSIAYNQPVPILDGNVIRVLTRLFAITDNPREKAVNTRLWSLAGELVRESARTPAAAIPAVPFQMSGPCSMLNQALMELGALVCTAKLARCGECPLQGSCRARAGNQVSDLPRTGPRIKPTSRRFIAFAIALAVAGQDRWLVRQRPADAINAHLWEFPSFEVLNDNPAPSAIFEREFKFVPGELRALPVIRHSITRYRISLEPFVIDLSNRLRPAQAGYEWKTGSDVEALALTSAHRKLWRHLTRLRHPSPAGSGKNAG